MKRITTIVLFAGIFAVAAGMIGLSGNSATPLMIAATSQSPELVGMLGHVEYKLLGDDGNVKAYLQTDNIVTQDGSNCSADAIFGTASTQCTLTSNFNYIGIGNGTITGAGTHLGIANRTLADATEGDDIGNCSDDGLGGATVGGGEMARRLVTPTITEATGGTAGAVVELNTSEPFTFNTSNATDVIDSGVFNADYDGTVTDGKCDGTVQQDATTDWNMFSRQLLNGVTGIAVSQGDSLSVKWTITVG